MDEPILYPRYKSSPTGMYKHTLYRRLAVAFENDEKDEFMRLIKDPGFEEERHDYKATDIFWNDALEIAIAVFNGEIKGVFDMEELFIDGFTPLHLAAYADAPRLVNYFVERGDNVDAVCHHNKLDLDYTTPIDLCTSRIVIGESFSTFDMLWWLCFHNRDQMEIIRMLVRGKQSKTWARDLFLKYARKGELDKLAALFLAVPELFLSSPKTESSWLSKLNLKLENNTHLEKQLSLLLDVFALVGPNLAAYIRLEEFLGMKSRTTIEGIQRSQLELDFFLREVARKKLGVPSPDYYLSFFEVPEQDPLNLEPDLLGWSDDEEYAGLPDWDRCVSELVGTEIYEVVPYFLTRKDVDRTDIYRAMPSLEHEGAARLTGAIEKKLSSVSSLDGCLETIAKTSKKTKKWERHQLLGLPVVSSGRFQPSVGAFHTSVGSANPVFRSFHASAGSANPMFGVKFTATKNLNQVMESIKLKSFFDSVKLSQFPLVAKRLLK